MNQTNDRILKALVNKKVELLQNLLVQSQHFVTVHHDTKHEQLMTYRQSIFQDLQKNDSCIEQRERAIGIRAHHQENEAFAKIKFLLHSIQSNNSQSLDHLEKENKGLKREKSELEKGNKLSGYIYQQKSNISFKPMVKQQSKNRPMKKR